MQSKAYNHFPQFSFRDGKKMLWNPVPRKAFKNRPEERVRLQLLEYLTLETNFSRHRISFEAPVRLDTDKTLSRTDLICHDNSFNPYLLIECKAPDIPLDEKVALQIARYNRNIEAPLLLISNGLRDFWYESAGNDVRQLAAVPETFASTKKINRDYNYWEQRGFAGKTPQTDARRFIAETCNRLFTKPEHAIRYFNFEDTPEELGMGHYYFISPQSDNDKLALTFSATPHGGSRLNAVLNREGTNRAFLSSSLDLISENESSNTLIYSEKGSESIDLRKAVNFTFDQPVKNYFTPFADILLSHC